MTMSLRILTCCVLLSFSSAALADSYLCTAKYAAGVTEKEDDVTQAQSGEYDKKYLVDERGFRPFDDDNVKLSKCNFIDGRPAFCEDPGVGWSGFFILPSNLVFTYFAVIGGHGGILEAMVVKGKCSKIQAD